MGNDHGARHLAGAITEVHRYSLNERFELACQPLIFLFAFLFLTSSSSSSLPYLQLSTRALYALTLTPHTSCHILMSKAKNLRATPTFATRFFTLREIKRQVRVAATSTHKTRPAFIGALLRCAFAFVC